MQNNIQPLVSVIIPIYNSETWLKKCVDSVIFQTYKNLEIILVDDGSTDSSGKICDDYQKSDQRIKVMHKENSGVSSARNSALKTVTGSFLSFIDSDDYIEKNSFEKLIPFFEDMSVDAVFFGWFEEKDRILQFPISKEDTKISNIEAVKSINSFDGSGYCGYLCNKIYRINGNISKFETEIPVCEDYIWNLEMLKHCKNVMQITSPYYHYIQRGSSASHFSAKQMNEIKARLRILDITKENWSELTYMTEIKTMYSFIKMKKRLYYRNDSENLKILRPYLKKFRHKFYFASSHYVPFKIKLEAFGLEVLTFLKVNSGFLKYIDGLMFGKQK